MAFKSGFFDAQPVGNSYAPSYNATDFSTYFATYFSDGVCNNPTNSALQVTPGSTGLSVNVNVGRAVIDGRFLNNTTATTLTLDPAGAEPRIDNIVVELNLRQSSMYLTNITGTGAASPTAPTLVNSNGITQLCLAQIAVPANATSISNCTITDTRGDNTLCGYSTADATIVALLQQILTQLTSIEKTLSGSSATTTAGGFTPGLAQFIPALLSPGSSDSTLYNMNILNLAWSVGGRTIKMYATELIVGALEEITWSFPEAFNQMVIPLISPAGVQNADGGWESPSGGNMQPYGNNGCTPACNNENVTVCNPWGLTGSFYLFVVGY